MVSIALYAAPSGGRLRSPSKTVHKPEAELFQGMAQGTLGLGRLEGAEKKWIAQTVEKEKQGILRQAMRQVYENAYELYRAGRYKEALSILERVIALDPNYDQAVRLHSALSSAASGAAPAGPPSERRRGRSLSEQLFYDAIGIYKQGRRVEAIEKFEEVRALDPRHRKAAAYIAKIHTELAAEYFEKGKIAYTQGRLPEALESFYSAVNLDPEGYSFLQRQITDLETEIRGYEIETRLSRALAQLTAGEWEKARATAKSIYELDPGNPRASELIAEAYQKEADQYIMEGDRQFERKRYNEAISFYEKVRKLGKQKEKAERKIEAARAALRREEEQKKKKEEEERAKKEVEERVKAALGTQEGASQGAAAETPAAVVTEDARRAAEGHFEQAMRFYHNGDLHRALTELNLALKYDPNNQNAYTAKRRIEADLAK